MVTGPAIEGELRQGLQDAVSALPAGGPITALAFGQQGQADCAGEAGRRAARPFGEHPPLGVDGGQLADFHTGRGELRPEGVDLHRLRNDRVPTLPEAAQDQRRDGQRGIRSLRAEGGRAGKLQAHFP